MPLPNRTQQVNSWGFLHLSEWVEVTNCKNGSKKLSVFQRCVKQTPQIRNMSIRHYFLRLFLSPDAIRLVFFLKFYKLILQPTSCYSYCQLFFCLYLTYIAFIEKRGEIWKVPQAWYDYSRILEETVTFLRYVYTYSALFKNCFV